MTYEMTWHITIGRFELAMIEKVNIKKSVELLSDTATITLPATAYNKALDIESKVKRGDKVEIWLGYDADIALEFEGYVDSIKDDGGSLEITCEDRIYKFRVPIKDTVLKDADVSDILKYVNSEVSAVFLDEPAIELNCDYSFKYDKFVFDSVTGYDVLKKIQEEAKPNVYMKGNVLHVHPQYAEIFGEEIFDFSINIQSSDLKYKNANEKKYLIEVETTDKSGNVTKYTAGEAGGDKFTMKAGGVSDPTSLQKMADEELKKRNYTGYEGSINGWLIPYVEPGYKVTIKDAEYPERNGNYYVLGTEINFSSAGGERVITVGKKISA